MSTLKEKSGGKRRAYLVLVSVLVLLALMGGLLFQSAKNPMSRNVAKEMGEPSAGSAADGSASNTGAQEKKSRRPVKAPVAQIESVKTPIGDARTVVEKLRPLAEAGDARASLLIYMKLSECGRLPNMAAIEETAAILEKAGASGVQYVRDQERNRKDCESVAGTEHTRGQWLERAADAGDVNAQLLFAADASSVLNGASGMLRDPDAVKKYKAKAAAFMTGLASRGNRIAMMQLAGEYEEGVILPKDSMRAYAYYRAMEIAQPGSVSAELLTAQASKVPPGQIGKAEALAREIYSACCRL